MYALCTTTYCMYNAFLDVYRHYRKLSTLLSCLNTSFPRAIRFQVKFEYHGIYHIDITPRVFAHEKTPQLQW